MKVNGVTIRRSYLEVPTMDERKWAKVPSIAADVVMADIEDSVPPNLKDAAREKVVSLIHDASFLDGREFICRPNSLETPWGRDDLEALAEAGAPFVLYPKPRSADDVREVLEIFAKRGSSPELHLIIETPQAVLYLEELAAVEGVSGLLFGPGDLSMESGIALFADGDVFDEGFLYPRAKTQIAASALGLEATEGLLVADLKNQDAVRAAAVRSIRAGFTGNLAFYPPHIDIINAARTPTASDVTWYTKVVSAFEEAQAEGRGAVVVDGRRVTVHQFTQAQGMLRVASALGLA